MSTTLQNLPYLPKYIDLDKWEHAPETELHWAGEVDLNELPRLAASQELPTTEFDKVKPLYMTLDVTKKSGVIWLHVESRGEIWQTCQRCLEPVAVSLDYANDIALLTSEDQLNLLEETDDYLLISELSNQLPNVGDSKKIAVVPMLEDELLMQQPLAPKHEDCELAVTEVGDFAEEKEDSPFAVLASLKGQLKS